MKQHTVKILETKNGKTKSVRFTQNGDQKVFTVSKKGKVFDGNKEIGQLKRERLRWFDNQFKIVFNDGNTDSITIPRTPKGSRKA